MAAWPLVAWSKLPDGPYLDSKITLEGRTIWLTEYGKRDSPCGWGVDFINVDRRGTADNLVARHWDDLLARRAEDTATANGPLGELVKLLLGRPE